MAGEVIGLVAVYVSCVGGPLLVLKAVAVPRQVVPI